MLSYMFLTCPVIETILELRKNRSLIKKHIKKLEKNAHDTELAVQDLNYSELDNAILIKALIHPLKSFKIDKYLSHFPPTDEQKREVWGEPCVSLGWKLTNIGVLGPIVLDKELFDAIKAEKNNHTELFDNCDETDYSDVLFQFFSSYKTLTAWQVGAICSVIKDAEIFRVHVRKNVMVLDYGPESDLLVQKAKMKNLGIDDPKIIECEVLIKEQMQGKRDIEVERVLRENKALHKYLKSST